MLEQKKLAWEQLSRYNHIIKENDNIYRQAARHCQLPETALWILYFLRTGCVQTQRDLCSHMYQSKQSIHSALKKLAVDGYIELHTNEEKHTCKDICLTEQGCRLAEATADRILQAELAAFSRISEEEREAMLSGYEQFTALLKQEMRQFLEQNEVKIP